MGCIRERDGEVVNRGGGGGGGKERERERKRGRERETHIHNIDIQKKKIVRKRDLTEEVDRRKISEGKYSKLFSSMI